MSITNDANLDLSVDESTNVEDIVVSDISSDDEKTKKKQKSKKEKSSDEVKYICRITGQTFTQKSHYDKHLSTEKYKDKLEIFKLKLNNLTDEELMKEYQTTNKDNIMNYMVNNGPKPEAEDEFNKITGSSSLREEIHKIHNIFRNSGAGYGMNALKVFNIMYGLMRIDNNKFFDKSGLPESCKFSKIIDKCKDKETFNKDEFSSFVLTDNDGVLDSLYNHDYFKNFLFYEIPRNINGDTLRELFLEVNKLKETESNTGEQLSGKIYEYFIGRDETAISELGAYFTNRHIVEFIYNEEPVECFNGNVETMIDPYAGSGGFTTGYIMHLKDKDKENKINWDTQLKNVYHYDMNEDVIKSAMLEFYCLTGAKPTKSHMEYANSFKSDFGNKRKFKYIYTNPPYGGDKAKKTEYEERLECVKEELENRLKEASNINYEEQLQNIKEKLKEISRKKKEHFTSLDNLKRTRIHEYAKKHNLKASDKEGVSLIQLMDLVDDGGKVVGVLKEGVFFDKKYKDLRKHLIENFNVRKVISVDSSQFENTTTKTSILVFDNNGQKTSSIEFSELEIYYEDENKFEMVDGKLCLTKWKGNNKTPGDFKKTGKKVYCNASYDDIKKNDYTLNHKKYNIKTIIPGDDYKLVKLGDVCEIKNGYAFKTSDFINDGIKVVKIKDIKNNIVDLKNVNSYVKYNNKYKNYTILNNDIILTLTGKSGNICNIALYKSNSDEILFLNQRLCFIRNCKFDKYYLLSIFKTIGINLLNINSTNGSIQGNISINEIESLQLPIPNSESKMKYWVDRISEPYNKVQDCKNKLKALEDKVKTDIQHMLDNNDTEEVKLGDLCEFKSGSKFNMNPYIVKKSKFGILRTRNLDSKSSDFIFINEEGFKKVKNCILKVNDIIISAFTDSFCCEIINKKYDNYTFNGGLFRLNNFKINLKYLYHYFKSKKFLNIIRDNGVSSTASQVNIKTLKEIKITLPKDRKLLDSFNPTFEEIDKLNDEIPKQEALYQQYLDELKKEAIKS